MTAFGIAKRAGVFPAHRLDDVSSIVHSIERYQILKWIVARLVRRPSSNLVPQLVEGIQTRIGDIGFVVNVAEPVFG